MYPFWEILIIKKVSFKDGELSDFKRPSSNFDWVSIVSVKLKGRRVNLIGFLVCRKDYVVK